MDAKFFESLMNLSEDKKNQLVRFSNELIKTDFILIKEIVIENNKVLTEQLLQSNLVKILGEENKIPERLTESIQYDFLRELKYDNKTTFMELVDLLKKHGELHAEDLWKMSKHYDNKNIGESIDKFYTDLKKKIEVDKTVKEVINKKGYLELV